MGVVYIAYRSCYHRTFLREMSFEPAAKISIFPADRCVCVWGGGCLGIGFITRNVELVAERGGGGVSRYRFCHPHGQLLQI